MKWLFSLFMFAFATTAYADEIDRAPDWVPFRGVGILSCGHFLQHKAENNRNQLGLYVEWTWGYISAYNGRRAFGDQPQPKTKYVIQDIPDFPTVIAFLDKYCRNNPLQSVANGVDVLISELGGVSVSGPVKK